MNRFHRLSTPFLSLSALVRPGRFDKLVAVVLPDIRGRKQILEHHMRGVTVAKGRYAFTTFQNLISYIFIDVDPQILARGTPGFSGADLQNMVKYVFSSTVNVILV